MSDYIPTDENGKIQWLINCAAWLSTHGTGYGFIAADIFSFNMVVNTARTAVDNNTTAQAAARAATAIKRTALAAAVDLGAAEVAGVVERIVAVTAGQKIGPGAGLHVEGVVAAEEQGGHNRRPEQLLAGGPQVDVDLGLGGDHPAHLQ